MIELLQEWEVVSYSAIEDARQEKLQKLKIWSNLFLDEYEEYQERKREQAQDRRNG